MNILQKAMQGGQERLAQRIGNGGNVYVEREPAEDLIVSQIDEDPLARAERELNSAVNQIDGYTEESQKNIDSGPQPSVPAILKWGQLHESMLIAWITDGDWWGEDMQALAKRLNSDGSEFESIRKQIPDETWHGKRMEKLLELEELKQRGFNWDKLEGAAISKLVTLVTTKRLTLPEMLAVARVANQATRRGSTAGGAIMEKPMGGNANQTNVQVNMYGQPIGDTALPGQGGIGKVTLSLSQRTVSQLGKGKTIEGEAERLHDTVEMLTPEDVKGLNELIEPKVISDDA
jgi:hypothetical protein